MQLIRLVNLCKTKSDIKMKYWIAILYTDLKHKKLDIPYFRAMIFVTFAILLHLFQLGMMFGITNYLIPIGPSSDAKIIRSVKMLFIVLSIYYVMTFLFPRKTIATIAVTAEQLKKDRWKIYLYFIISFSVLIAMLVYKGYKTGVLFHK